MHDVGFQWQGYEVNDKNIVLDSNNDSLWRMNFDLHDLDNIWNSI